MAGSFGKHEALTVVGGNSSVLGLNWEGEEVFWTVVTGKVCAMIALDFDKDGENEVSNYDDIMLSPHKLNLRYTQIT